ncbi:hypothetical protein FV139_12870 [Parahaliea maris]|uniref:Uncharacterized protein n=1 Tax=Parahaliea maris TaxID=2716870 RepID=A0A5C8ZWC6_9GAMM|nr:hypothetical protein [Parahaliea maris]TXS92853.1 hypothetical protein FV139_12870 [Parahaliea maris]
MSHHHCPFCASRATASRRSLFLALLHEQDLPPLFDWYTQRVPRSFPPRSLLLLLGLCLLGLALPALFLWHQDAVSALQITGSFALLLITALGFDLLITLADYRRWNRERVCGQCRGIYRVNPSQVASPITIIRGE